MSSAVNSTVKELKVSKMAEDLMGSEIIKLAGEINEKIKQGEKIFNLTIGDFNSELFPIPNELKQYIVEAYNNNETNYPPADGVLALRESVKYFIKKHANLDYETSEILIAGGARPIIYAIYQTLIDKDDVVVFPVPSWNNNHYTHLSQGKQVFLETSSENNFMPTAAEIKPLLKNATLLSLCSPLNPTGTVFTKQNLEEICDLVIEENKSRDANQKPLYILYDQIYYTLTFGDIKHYTPTTLRPELRDYTIYVDGISKAFAATGVRVGWSMGPKKIIDKMKSIIGHVGAWAPKAEQVASAKYLKEDMHTDSFLNEIKIKINDRLTAIYKGFSNLKDEGYPVDAISPKAAIYLTVKIDLVGKIKLDGTLLRTTQDVTSYILNEAKIAIVPFSAFGASANSFWFRISVGTCKMDEIPEMINNLKQALQKLS